MDPSAVASAIREGGPIGFAIVFLYLYISERADRKTAQEKLENALSGVADKVLATIKSQSEMWATLRSTLRQDGGA